MKKECAEFLGATSANFDENPEFAKKSDSGFLYMGELWAQNKIRKGGVILAHAFVGVLQG